MMFKKLGINPIEKDKVLISDLLEIGLKKLITKYLYNRTTILKIRYLNHMNLNLGKINGKRNTTIIVK